MTPTEFWRGGQGEPLVLLHGLTGTWEAWLPVLGPLAEVHDVLAITLPAHHGGAALEDAVRPTVAALADALERRLDAQGLDTFHVAGNSLGGLLAFELGRRGRARSVVALSPAGAWQAEKDLTRVIRMIASSHKLMTGHGHRLGGLLRRPRFRKLAFRQVMEHGDRVPAAATEGLVAGVTGTTCIPAIFEEIRAGGSLARAAAPECPVLIAWAERDRTIGFERYGRPFLEAAGEGVEHVMLPGVGHVPMYDDPDLVVRTILGVTTRKQEEQHMSTSQDLELDGRAGKVVVRRWEPEGEATSVVLLSHGFGEHSGRYEHVAAALNAVGAAVFAPDHASHGRSEGPRADLSDLADVVADLETLAARVREEHSGVPFVAMGHSMGGLLTTRYVQTTSEKPDAIVLSGPFLGNPAFEPLLGLDELPEIPIDPALLSRDPAVGEAYLADELVYHGPLLKSTLHAMFDAVGKVTEGPDFGGIPTLWIHGEADGLATAESARPIVERLAGDALEAHVYEGAAHEVLNETNKDEVLEAVTTFVGRTARQPA
jgi:alpha-beta hydrolase superfamily lysophospholipase